MFLNLRAQYSAGTTPRQTADAVITALTPAAWYRNATGVTSAGGFASQWDDYSGNARHLVQATGTNQPAYSAGVFTFDGLDNFMDMTDAALIQPVTVYAVLNQKTWAASDRLFDGAAVNTCFVQQSATAASPNIRSFGGGAYSADLADLAVNTRAILACSYAGASSSVRVNNNAAITGNYGSTAIGGLTLGASGTPSLYGNVAYEEFVMFLADHDDATQSSVITALNNALTVF